MCVPLVRLVMLASLWAYDCLAVNFYPAYNTDATAVNSELPRFETVLPAQLLERYSSLSHVDMSKEDLAKSQQLNNEMAQLEANFQLEKWEDCAKWDELNAQYKRLTGSLNRIPSQNFSAACQIINLAHTETSDKLQWLLQSYSTADVNRYLEAIYQLETSGGLFKELYGKYLERVNSDPDLKAILKNIRKLSHQIADQPAADANTYPNTNDPDGQSVHYVMAF